MQTLVQTERGLKEWEQERKGKGKETEEKGIQVILLMVIL